MLLFHAFMSTLGSYRPQTYPQIQFSFEGFNEYLLGILHKFTYNLKLERTEKTEEQF